MLNILKDVLYLNINLLELDAVSFVSYRRFGGACCVRIQCSLKKPWTWRKQSSPKRL